MINRLFFFIVILYLLKDFQLYADIAREFPLIKIDHLSSELTDDDTLTTIGHFVQLNIEEYL
jgi:hypothetical protein